MDIVNGIAGGLLLPCLIFFVARLTIEVDANFRRRNSAKQVKTTKKIGWACFALDYTDICNDSNGVENRRTDIELKEKLFVVIIFDAFIFHKYATFSQLSFSYNKTSYRHFLRNYFLGSYQIYLHVHDYYVKNLEKKNQNFWKNRGGL